MTTMTRFVTIAACIAVAAALAGCRDEPVATQDPSPQPAATVGQSPVAEAADTVDQADAVRQYVEAIASKDPTVMREALDLTADGSTAYAYLMFQTTYAEALLDSGFSSTRLAGEVNRSGDGFEICYPESDCTLFTGFAQTGGLLSDLTVDGKEPGPRLTLGNGQTIQSHGVTAQFLTAYRAITQDALVITVRLETAEDTTASPFLYSATYRASDGAQRTASDAYGPDDLGAASHATTVMIFDRVEPGGKVTLEGCVNNCDGDFTLTLQVG